ncbi:MAG: CBS domain-containing protein, partial [Thermomicrobiales bacterium]
LTLAEIERIATGHDGPRGQHLYPVLDGDGKMVSVVTRRELQAHLHEPAFRDARHPLEALEPITPVLAYPAETLRGVAARMAETGLTTFPVVERARPTHVLGIIGLPDLLRARERQLADDRKRERWLRIRLLPGSESSPNAELTEAAAAIDVL